MRKIISIIISVFIIVGLLPVSSNPNENVVAFSETESDEINVKTVYEAEAGFLSGKAIRKEDSFASGGAVVTRIGAEGTDTGNIVFNTVYAPKDGTYGSVLKFSQNGSRTFYVSVNGGEGIDVPKSHENNHYDTVTTRYLNLPLKAGNNSVRVYSYEEHAVEVDCLTVFAPSRPYGGKTMLYSEAKLSSQAYIRKCYGLEEGSVITNLGEGGTAEFNITTETGIYNLGVWYSSPECRALEVYVDNKLATTMYTPRTSELFMTDNMSTQIQLTAGNHKIKFGNAYAPAPDIGKINVRKIDGAKVDAKVTGIQEFKNDYFTVKYDMATGVADYYHGGILRVKGLVSAVKAKNDDINLLVQSTDYNKRTVSVQNVNDGYGPGKIYKVVSTKNNYPQMTQSFYVYDNQQYVLVRVELSDKNPIKTNFMAPIAAVGAGAVYIGEKNDVRSIKMPFDNDSWVRYDAKPVNEGINEGFYATAIYDNQTRNSVVTGSVDHDTWKTGVTVYGDKDSNVNYLEAYGGHWSEKYSYDFIPHGSITGKKVLSPRIMLGYFDDWRDGLVEFGKANINNVPRLEWKKGIPYGYNSWYAQKSRVTWDETTNASNLIRDLQNKGFADKDGVAYINLDAGGGNVGDFKTFIDYLHKNGQKAGNYFAHGICWDVKNTINLTYSTPIGDIKWREVLKEDGYGGVAGIENFPNWMSMDPTHPYTLAGERAAAKHTYDTGFEFFKIDFMTQMALEGSFYDPNVTTGMQAYHVGAKGATLDVVDPDKVFISESIAPIFPYQYAHTRRISCDIFTNIYSIEYLLNSLTYGFWQSGTIYNFIDADLVVLSSSPREAYSRYNASIVTGSMIIMSDRYEQPGIREFVTDLMANEEINELTKDGVAFRPVDGNTGIQACDTFVRQKGDEFYMGIFNYSGSDVKNKTIDLERAGLEKGKQYIVYDMWTKKSFTTKDTLSVELLPVQSTLLRISPVAQ